MTRLLLKWPIGLKSAIVFKLGNGLYTPLVVNKNIGFNVLIVFNYADGLHRKNVFKNPSALKASLCC